MDTKHLMAPTVQAVLHELHERAQLAECGIAAAGPEQKAEHEYHYLIDLQLMRQQLEAALQPVMEREFPDARDQRRGAHNQPLPTKAHIATRQLLDEILPQGRLQQAIRDMEMYFITDAAQRQVIHIGMDPLAASAPDAGDTFDQLMKSNGCLRTHLIKALEQAMHAHPHQPPRSL